MNRGDQLIERGAARLEALARDAAAKGGSQAKLADELLEDAQFLRKLKPSLIAARARGEAPQEPPGAAPATPVTPEITETRPPQRTNRDHGGKHGPNPFLVAGAALAAGILLAKVIDWRSHAHPRD